MERSAYASRTDSVARAQIAMFHSLGEAMRLSVGDRAGALDLDERTWQAWTAFSRDGALPAAPPLPEMLRRLGEATFHLSTMHALSSVEAGRVG